MPRCEIGILAVNPLEGTRLVVVTSDVKSELVACCIANK
jgi:hypothetical protein